MFEEVGEQYNQYVASSRTSLPFPLHSFDPFTNSHHHNLPIHIENPHVHFPQLHQKDQEAHHHQDEAAKSSNLFGLATTSERERERSIGEDIESWSSNEVLALNKIISGTENWFPDFSWEHVSRKLEELGFKKSAEKCKEKFEEESRQFNSMTFGKDYRLFSQLEVLCQSDQNASVLAGKALNIGKLPKDEMVLNKSVDINGKEKDSTRTIIRECELNSLSQENGKKTVKEKMKRKRHNEYEMLKYFCEDIVTKMMSQQEEMYNKIIEEMVKKDDDKISREEAWKKQEMERIAEEIESRAREQAIARERQAKLTEFLQKITSNICEKTSFRRENDEVLDVSNASISSKPLNGDPFTSSTMGSPSQNPILLGNIQCNQKILISENETPQLREPSSSLAMVEQKLLTSSSSKMRVQNLGLSRNEGEELGKRWPREEVLALISLRGSINGNNTNEEKEGTHHRGPLWERISQGMLEMGYKRSSKRCKEKWENINKYFRKTKDANKKRSIESRTCPYFEQLSNLYGQGGSLALPTDPLESPSLVPEKSSGSSDLNVLSGEKDLV